MKKLFKKTKGFVLILVIILGVNHLSIAYGSFPVFSIKPMGERYRSRRFFPPRFPKKFVQGQVLVKFKPNTPPQRRNSLKTKAGVKKTLQAIGPKNNEDIYLFKLKPSISVQKAINEFKKNPNVIAAAPNYIRKANYTPNDPQFPNQWGFNNTGQTIEGIAGTPDADIDAPEAWDIERGNSNPVKVAVIDTGVDQDHPDLAEKISDGYNWAGISQYYFNGAWSLGYGASNKGFAQSIKGTGQQLSYVGLFLAKNGNPAGNITVSVRNSLSGADLASYTITPTEVDTSGAEVYKQLSSSVTLTSGNTYYIVAWTNNSSSSSFYYVFDNTTEESYYLPDPYREGQEHYWNGSSWIDYPNDDLYFRTNPNSSPHDDNGHGTHVSGIVAAGTDNATGVAGVSPGAKIMSLKAGDSAGFLYSVDIVSAIYYAADNGVQIINMSFGGDEFSSLEQQAVNYAFNNGVALFAASGNSAGSTVDYPASYQNVIGVGATNNQDQWATFSTYNSTVDISAPGVDILSTMPTYSVGMNSEGFSLNYDYSSGTSMASPVASGLGALIRSSNPSLTPQQVEQIIEDNADDRGTIGRDDYYGWGRINAYRAITSNLIKNPSFETDTDSNNIPDNWTPFQFATGDGRSADFTKEGLYSLKIVGNPTRYKRVSQRINIGGIAGESLVLSGYNKTIGTSSTGGCIDVLVYLNNTDGTKSMYGLRFYRNTHDWLYRSRTIAPAKNYSSLDVYVVYYIQTGTAYFDDLKLSR